MFESRNRRGDIVPSIGVAIGAMLWGLFWLPVRAIEQTGVSVMWTGPVIFATVTVALLPAAVSRWRRFRAAGPVLLSGGTLAASAFVLYIVSFNLTDVVRALLLFYLTPLWSTLLGFVVLGERITLNRILGVLLAFGGLVAVLGTGIQFPWPRGLGDWLALGGGVCWSFACVKLFQGGPALVFEKTFTFVICGLGVSVVLALLPLGVDNTVPNGSQVMAAWPWLLAVSALMLPATFLTIWPASLLSPAKTGILFSLEIIVGVASAAMLTNEPFGHSEILGTILILGAVIMEVLPPQAVAGLTGRLRLFGDQRTSSCQSYGKPAPALSGGK